MARFGMVIRHRALFGRIYGRREAAVPMTIYSNVRSKN
jgi:hypothetical protein